MAPVEIYFENKGEATGEVLKVEPSRKEDLKKIMPVLTGGETTCDVSDNFGTLLYEGNEQYVHVVKTAGGHELGIVVEAGKEMTFRGSEGVRISSPLIDTSIHIVHKKSPPKRDIGNITGGRQTV